LDDKATGESVQRKRPGLMVPKLAARVSSMGLAVMAKTPPAIAINTVPKINSVFRPQLSATSVIRMVIAAPPASAAVKIQPMAVALRVCELIENQKNRRP